MRSSGIGLMKVNQLKLKKMATFCYIISDSVSKSCVLIDPASEIKKILQKVKNEGFKVIHVINTHSHFDHTSGNAAIIQRTKAKLLIHHLDAKQLNKLFNRMITRISGGRKSPVPDRLLKDGDEIKVGKTSLRVIHTPGHTPGSICLYAEGNLFSGDTLFVSSIGRTDLPGGSRKLILRSIREKLYTLPEDTIVWPGHDYGISTNSTIGREKKTNPFT